MNNKILGNKGFTLVEVMVALLITGILMVIVFRFIFDQMNGYRREQMVSDMQQNLRVTMDEISRDIRMAGAGIPNVPIYTGWSGFSVGRASGAVYPLSIASESPSGNVTRFDHMFQGEVDIAGNENNDSIMILYQDPIRSKADTTLSAGMIANVDAIVVPTSSVDINQGGTATNGTGFRANIPIIITDMNATKADLFMITGITGGNTLQVADGGAGDVSNIYNRVAGVGANYGHNINYSAATAANGIAGYPVGSRIFAVRVIRYDWSPSADVANSPITRIVNNDITRDTDGAIGEYFGNNLDTGPTAVALTNITAMRILWTPPSNVGAAGTAIPAASFSRGMPTNPYTIGMIRIALTAHTPVNNASSSLFRTRTLTQDAQPRNYMSW